MVAPLIMLMRTPARNFSCQGCCLAGDKNSAHPSLISSSPIASGQRFSGRRPYFYGHQDQLTWSSQILEIGCSIKSIMTRLRVEKSSVFPYSIQHQEHLSCVEPHLQDENHGQSSIHLSSKNRFLTVANCKC